jgi:hypothetical protein
MIVDARRTGLCQQLQRCWVFHAQLFPVCIKNSAPPKVLATVLATALIQCHFDYAI